MSSKLRRTQIFLERYSQELEFVKKSQKGVSYALCSVCNCDINIAHGGKNDIIAHAKTSKHAVAYKYSSKKIPKMTDFLSTATDLETIRAEILFTGFLLEHNIPLAAADHVSKLLTAMFPNSPEVKKYSSGRTKTGHLVREIANHSTQRICDVLKTSPFSIATDGSNDMDNQMYPLVVTFFDKEAGQVSVSLFSLPILEADSTGKNIADLICAEFSMHNIPWENCLSLSCDNAYVMLGKKKGVYAYLKQQHSNLFGFGCLCHLINLAAEKGARTLPVSFDDLLIDIYYYFNKSAKRKLAYKEFQKLYSKDKKKILKHGITRWLSLGKCLTRLLEQWRSLLLYFKEECNKEKNKINFSPRIAVYKIPKINKHHVNADEPSLCTSKKNKRKPLEDSESPTCSKKAKQNITVGKNKVTAQNTAKSVSKKSMLQREERIFLSLSSNLFHSLACFVKNVINVFDKYNILLQCEAPRVHKLKADLTDFFTELLSRFVKISVINSSQSAFDVLFEVNENQKNGEDLVIGSEASNSIKELSEEELKEFYSHVRKYYCTACNYIITNFPHTSELLEHAEIADIAKRDSKSFSSLKYFIEKYPSLLLKKCEETNFNAIDELESEFLKYQLENLPEHVLNLDRADQQWAFLSKLKEPLGNLQYERLSQVMLGILTFPHSNAACERVFSAVRRNKTDFRSCLKPSTLQAVLVAKSRMTQPCYNQLYDEKFLRKAKSATTVALNQN